LTDSESLDRVTREFTRTGIILESDSRLPSVASLVACSIRGSWWGHPRGRQIFRVLRSFSGRSDVLATKLVSGKVTFVHRSLWPALFAVATSGERWQTASLSKKARSLLSIVEKQREVRTDRLPHRKTAITVADAARELEGRLLVVGTQVHTESGFHAKRLQTWETWAQSAGLAGPIPDQSEAKQRLEEVLDHLNRECDAEARLPWQAPPP